MSLRFWLLLALALALLATSAPALAAPATLQLRVEGATTTIFEGPVTTDGHALDAGDGSGSHRCDGTNAGVHPTPGPTMTSALADAPLPGGWHGTWNEEFQDFLIDRIGSDSGTPSSYWGTALNFQPAGHGGCQERVVAGDEALFALGDIYSEHLLKLTGPSSVAVGRAFTVQATDGKDGSKLGGAEIRDGAHVLGVTDGQGQASLSFDSAGVKRLKAERADSIRSNALSVCVYAASSADCGGFVPAGQALGTPAAGSGRRVRDSRAPTVRVSRPRGGRTFRGPRLLRGTASDDESGLSAVKLALRRHVRGKGCQWWSGRRERFVGRNCHKKFFFTIGDSAKWSYLLPRPLGPGHYVLDAKAFDRARNRVNGFERGRNRVVFDVTRPHRKATASGRGRPGARVQVMVVGRHGVLAQARLVHAQPAIVSASGRGCRVAGSTPLAALSAALRSSRLPYHVRDFGRCSAGRTGGSGQLFVDRIGRDPNSGRRGWFYKVDDHSGTAGAAEPNGPFGRRSGPLRPGSRVLWFYCVFDRAAGSCQRSLRVVPSSNEVRLGDTLAIRVTGYDNEGRGSPVRDATVALGAQFAQTDEDGVAALLPAAAGRALVRATKPGAVPAFPVRVKVTGR